MGTKFVIDDRFYQLPAFKAAFKAGREGKGDKFCWYRECIFIRMLVLSAQNIKFVNAAQMAQLTMMPENQCNLVWAVCVEKNVLRQQDGYYSASSWMAENHLLVSDSPANPQNLPIKEKAPKEDKINVFGCVFLTPSDIHELKEEYTEAEIHTMAENLHDWKMRNPDKVKGDYNDCAAMKRWVYKTLWKNQTPHFIEGMPNPVPSFMRD